MRQDELESWLVASLSDFTLSQSEALALRDILPRIRTDDIAFVRNKAFLLAREQVPKGGDLAVATLLWLEKINKVIANYQHTNIRKRAEAHFSPGENCRRQLLDSLVNARTSIDICVFTISDDRLSEAIVAAHNRGIKVRVITDDEKAMDQGSDIDYLRAQGIAIRKDASQSHMHHKFTLIDKVILINGSFNWTRSASDHNQENILVTDDAKLVSAYESEFEELWQQFSSSDH